MKTEKKEKITLEELFEAMMVKAEFGAFTNFKFQEFMSLDDMIDLDEKRRGVKRDD